MPSTNIKFTPLVTEWLDKSVNLQPITTSQTKSQDSLFAIDFIFSYHFAIYCLFGLFKASINDFGSFSFTSEIISLLLQVMYNLLYQFFWRIVFICMIWNPFWFICCLNCIIFVLFENPTYMNFIRVFWFISNVYIFI